MRLFLLYFRQGRPVEAVILSATNELMRLAVRGSLDSVELRLTGEEWVLEGEEPVQLGWLVHDDVSEVETFRAQMAPRAFAAG